MRGFVARRRQDAVGSGGARPSPLARDISVALALKAVALVAIYVLYFGPAHRIPVGPAQMAQALSAAR